MGTVVFISFSRKDSDVANYLAIELMQVCLFL